MGIEQKINQQLNKYPAIKKGVKRTYQQMMYALSPKLKSQGNIVRISPDDDAEFFFGYYDKSPWDATGRYVLCLKANDTWSDVAPKEAAEILLIDTENSNQTRVIAKTHSWNVQQGCMMQWLGPEYNKEIIYNDFRNGKLCSVILDVFSGVERVLDVPVYSVSNDGKFALTLDFTRLHRLRPGYGYSNVEEETKSEKLPMTTCIWKLDIATNTVTSLLKYNDFADFESRKEMEGAEHKVNHIMLNPSGNRFMVLHRWYVGARKYTRLVTCDIDGSNMYNLSDDDMVSHCYWKNDEEIIAFENKNGTGVGYYLMKDKSNQYTHMWAEMNADGHPSYSPDGTLVVTDTYPNRSRVATLKIMSEESVTVIAKVFAPFKYDNDTRCDLHPRWSRDGKRICFDSVFEGHRGLYMVNLINKTSVVMSCYNGEKYIKEQLDSIINQTVVPNEIVAIDDNSSDETYNILKYYKEKYPQINFVLKKNVENKGFIYNFIEAAKIATGDIIFFADQDDIWYKDKVETVMKAFVENKDALAINAAYDLIDSDGKKIKKKYAVKQKNNCKLKKISWRSFLLSPRFPGMSMAVKKELLDSIDYLEHDMIPAHDWYFNEAAAYRGGMYYLGNTLTGYRQHASNTVGIVKTNTKEALLKSRGHTLDFLKQTHIATKSIHSDESEILVLSDKLLEIDRIRKDNMLNSSIFKCIANYVKNHKLISRRCFFADSYTILKLKFMK